MLIVSDNQNFAHPYLLGLFVHIQRLLHRELRKTLYAMGFLNNTEIFPKTQLMIEALGMTVNPNTKIASASQIQG